MNTYIDQNDFTATYSPEDDKLRITPAYFLERDLFDSIKNEGFKWAPKQELFFAKYTPAREDFCLSIAGEISREEMTLAERAEIKAARLNGYSARRANESNAFSQAAYDISKRFEFGQPILVGHHSEGRARRDKERMEKNIEKAVLAEKKSLYWDRRSKAVENYANSKIMPRVIKNRINALLVELRSHQKDINHAKLALSMFEQLSINKDKSNFEISLLRHIGSRIWTGNLSPNYTIYSDLEDGKITANDALNQCLDFHYRCAVSTTKQRWIKHTLNRLAYERSGLPQVDLFNKDEITKSILQKFARDQGALKPIATKTKHGFRLESAVDLPIHIYSGQELELSAENWAFLMQDVGYEVVLTKKRKSSKPPILNIKADKIELRNVGGNYSVPQMAMTKAKYMAQRSSLSTGLSSCGRFRIRIMYIGTEFNNLKLYSIFLTDSKKHKIPTIEKDA